MAKHVAVHSFGGACAERVRWLPVSPPGPLDLNQCSTNHKPLVVGLWDESAESHLLTIMDVEVKSRDGRVQGVSFAPVSMLEHPGAFTDLQVTEVGSSDEVMIVTGSSLGCITVTRLVVPRMPGTGPQDIGLVGMEGAERVLEWAFPHKGAVASVDVHPETLAILTAGGDGALCILSSDADDGGFVPPFKASGAGYVGYTNARWTDSQTFATSSGVAGLELWDVRSGPRPTSTSQGRAKHATSASSVRPCDQRLHWLHVHPSRPNECAGGSTDGTVAVWDLRSVAEPLACTAGSEDCGPVWEVRFDTHGAAADAAAASTSCPVMFCCEGGLLGQAALAVPHTDGRHAQVTATAPPLYQSPWAVTSFDIESTKGQDVVCVTDAQTLVYAARW